MVVPEGQSNTRLIDRHSARDRFYLRELDVLDSLFLGKHPLLPARIAVGHAPEDNLRHLESRVAQTDCLACSARTDEAITRRVPYDIVFLLGAAIVVKCK